MFPFQTIHHNECVLAVAYLGFGKNVKSNMFIY